MANYTLVRRLEKIVHILGHYPGIDKNKLADRLAADYDLSCSVRTLERDFRSLESDFGISIVYDRNVQGYHIDKRDRDRAGVLKRFAALIRLGQVLGSSLQDSWEYYDHVVLNANLHMDNIDLIEPLLDATRLRQLVKFDYHSFQREDKSSYTVLPLQVREYLSRWYLVGLPQGGDRIRTYGIDRMDALEMTQRFEDQSPADVISQLAKFESVVGLNYDAHDEVEKVLLAVHPEQRKYLASLPLHASQQSRGTNGDDWEFIEIEVMPNYELRMQLLRMGDQVRVEKPLWLREEIKNALQSTLNYINKGVTDRFWRSRNEVLA